MVDDLQAEIERLNEDLHDAEVGLERAEAELNSLRRELQKVRTDYISNDEHLSAVEREVCAALADQRDEWARRYGSLAEDAHRILSDLAWRSTTGDPAAAATESAVGEFLEDVRTSIA